MGNSLARTDNGETIFNLLSSDNVKKRFAETTGKNFSVFKSAVTDIVKKNEALQKCDPLSIVTAVMLAVNLNLQIAPSLGQAYIVPMKGKAVLQIGIRGYIQLAYRSGQYKNLHAGVVHEGEIRSIHPVSGEPIIGEKISEEVIGYVAHLELVNGFSKSIYMTKAEISEHAQKYSQSYVYDLKSEKKSSLWSTNFDAMAQKTVLKKLLRHWGVMSVEMQQALQSDSKIVDENIFSREEIDITPDDELESEFEKVSPEVFLTQ